jgi:hypothetical protein
MKPMPTTGLKNMQTHDVVHAKTGGPSGLETSPMAKREGAAGNKDGGKMSLETPAMAPRQ